MSNNQPISVRHATLEFSSPESNEPVAMMTSASFSADVNERIPLADAVAKAKVAALPRDAHAQAVALAERAVMTRRGAQRVVWLLQAADSFAKVYEGISACTSGCNHCCRGPVLISRTEAAAISATTKAPIKKHPVDREEGAFIGVACTFLGDDGRCSIYEARPPVCRYHFNLDVDDLLCRVVPGAKIPVPSADSRGLQLTRLQVGIDDDWYDIREWFPRGRRG